MTSLRVVWPGRETDGSNRATSRVARLVQRAAVFGLLLVALPVQGCASSRHPAGSASTSAGPLGRPAPNFSLTDQFGHAEQLSDFRGRVVLLTFIDSRCTTLCPLTSDLMTKAEEALGPTYSLQLLAVNANIDFTSVSDVRTWSAEHRMLRRWLFLTGPLRELRAVWSSYGIQVKMVHGDIAHTAGVFVI